MVGWLICILRVPTKIRPSCLEDQLQTLSLVSLSLSLSLSLTHTHTHTHTCSRSLASMFHHPLTHSFTPPHSFFLSHIGHCLPSILPSDLLAGHCVSLSPHIQRISIHFPCNILLRAEAKGAPFSFHFIVRTGWLNSRKSKRVCKFKPQGVCLVSIIMALCPLL